MQNFKLDEAMPKTKTKYEYDVRNAPRPPQWTWHVNSFSQANLVFSREGKLFVWIVSYRI